MEEWMARYEEDTETKSKELEDLKVQAHTHTRTHMLTWRWCIQYVLVCAAQRAIPLYVAIKREQLARTTRVG